MSSTPMGYLLGLVALFGFARRTTRASRHGKRHDGDSTSVHERLAVGR